MPRRVPVLLSLLLVACGPAPSSDGSGAGGDPVPLASLCSAWAEAWCRAAVGCALVTEAQVPECARVRTSTCDQAGAEAQVRDGRVAYDGRAYGRCLEHLATAATCDEDRVPVPSENDPDCAAAAVGKVAHSEDCGEGFGPFGSRECERGRCGNAGCDGLCEPVPQRGEDCVYFCAGGLRCDEGVCRSLGGPGDPCRQLRDECTVGLFCQATGSGLDGTCREPLPAGAACDDHFDVCVTGTYCPSMTETPTCTPRGAEGDACDPFIESCAAGLRCDPFSDTCVAQASLDEDCSWHDDCRFPLACRAGRCVQPPIVGEPCGGEPEAEVICGTGWCDGTTCRPTLPDGASCSLDEECESYSGCVEGRCGSCY